MLQTTTMFSNLNHDIAIIPEESVLGQCKRNIAATEQNEEELRLAQHVTGSFDQGNSNFRDYKELNDKSLVRLPSKKYISTKTKELSDIIAILSNIKAKAVTMKENISKDENKH